MFVIEPKKKDNTPYIFFVIAIVFSAYVSLHMSIVYEKEYVQGVRYEDGEDIKDSVYQPPKLNWIELVGKTMETISTYPKAYGFFTDDVIVSLKFFFSTIFIGIVAALAYATSRKNYISGKEHGTAQWGNVKEFDKYLAKTIRKDRIRQLKKGRKRRRIGKDDVNKIMLSISDNTNVILSKTARISTHQMEGINNNIIIVGGSGSGKSRGFVLPNILQADSTSGCSFVITDPKGELLEKTGKYLESQGYRIRAVNFFEMTKSSGYNCFEYIHNDRESYETDVQSLVECIIVNTNGGKEDSGGEKFWDNSEKLFEGSLFYAVSTAFRKEDRSINTVMTLIGWLEIEEERDKKNSKLDAFFLNFADVYGQDHIAVRMYREFRSKCAGKTAKSIVVTAVARLQKFYAKSIQQIVAKDELHLDEIGDYRTALFIIMPPTDKSYNFLAGMVFTQLLQELNYKANALYGGRLPIHVKLILDEFANTCTIGGFTQIISYVRGLNISVVPILQSLSQLKSMYDDNQATTIINNCSTFIYLGGLSVMEDLKDISERLGSGTFDEKEYSHSRGGHGSSTINYKKIERKLLDPSEVGKISKNKSIVMITGEKPLFTEKFEYKCHENYKYTSDADKNNSYVYDPLKIREEEQERLLKKRGIVNLDGFKKDRLTPHREYPNSVEKLNKAIKEGLPEIELDEARSYETIKRIYVGLEPFEGEDDLEIIYGMDDIGKEQLKYESEVFQLLEKSEAEQVNFYKSLVRDELPDFSSTMESALSDIFKMTTEGGFVEVDGESGNRNEGEILSESEFLESCGIGIPDNGEVALFKDIIGFEDSISWNNFDLGKLYDISNHADENDVIRENSA